MPGGKKSGKKNKAKEKTEVEYGPGTDPGLLFSLYAQFCKNIGLEVNESVKRSLTNTENPLYGKQILIDGNESPFGPGGCRALVTSILGRGKGMPLSPEGLPIIYTSLRELRLWGCSIGNDGAMVIAEILRLGGSELRLVFLELLDANIEANGTAAIGRAMSMNKSLLCLILDFNRSLGVDGVANLCKGLRTNSTLKKLSLKHCNIFGPGENYIHLPHTMLSAKMMALVKLIIVI